MIEPADRTSKSESRASIPAIYLESPISLFGCFCLNIFTEPEENRATHLVVSLGLFSKERKLIPTNWIETVSEDSVQLAIESRVIEDLPPY